MRYIPLGVGVVIPPWNFAAAIMGGMTLASIVTGNTVVVKPSSDSPTIAAIFVDILYEAGVPRDVVSFFTGPGGTAGEALVTNPKTRYIAFTGSKEAGLRISEHAAKEQPGQIWIKRTVLEMGGKDAIIVDEEADLDAAVEGVAISAFGYQGQKCSACSRAIVAEKVYDKFLEKLIPRVKQMKVGTPENPENYMGPVINKASMKSILEYIETGKKEGRLVTGGKQAGTEGYFIEPTVIADVSPKARIFQEEIFGPVLAVTKAKDFDRRPRDGERHGIRADRRGLFEESEENRARGRGISRRQPLLEPEVHGRNGRRASLRRIQYVGNGFEIRRTGLFASFLAGEDDLGKDFLAPASCRRFVLADRESKTPARCRRYDGITGAVGFNPNPHRKMT